MKCVAVLALLFIVIMGASITESRQLTAVCFSCLKACYNTNTGRSDLEACVCDACGSDCAKKAVEVNCYLVRPLLS
jgi:rRNA maturation endonuclease Nob1